MLSVAKVTSYLSCGIDFGPSSGEKNIFYFLQTRSSSSSLQELVVKTQREAF
jgi:hypothetical protein